MYTQVRRQDGIQFINYRILMDFHEQKRVQKISGSSMKTLINSRESSPVIYQKQSQYKRYRGQKMCLVRSHVSVDLWIGNLNLIPVSNKIGWDWQSFAAWEYNINREPLFITERHDFQWSLISTGMRDSERSHESELKVLSRVKKKVNITPSSGHHSPLSPPIFFLWSEWPLL